MLRAGNHTYQNPNILADPGTITCPYRGKGGNTCRAIEYTCKCKSGPAKKRKVESKSRTCRSTGRSSPKTWPGLIFDMWVGDLTWFGLVWFGGEEEGPVGYAIMINY